MGGVNVNDRPRRDVDQKIRVKGGPKIYKSGPGLTKRARLYQSLVRLQLAAARLSRNGDPEAMWAACLASDLNPIVKSYGPKV